MVFIASPASAAPIGSGSCSSTANSDVNVSVSSTSGYCYVAFKGTGSNSWTAPAGTTSADFLIVAGGGAGGSGAWGGGGGAGGVVFYSGYSVSSSTPTQLNVGLGGIPGTASLDPAQNRSGNGGNSWIGSVSGVVAIGGGAGASYAYGSTSANSSGSSGGSGGGATENTSTNLGGSSTQTLPSGAAAKYGNDGGVTANAANQAGAGGGGAGAAGGASTGFQIPGAGGAGTNTYATYVNLFSIGVSGYIAGGGGGGTPDVTRALGGSSVGGRGGSSTSYPGEAGAANTGSGGGGCSYNGSYQGGAGGTGLIIIRYLRAIVSVTNITSSNADGEYVTGDTLNISVTFSETLTVTGSPLLPLETGNTDANATYVSGSGTPTLTFTYVIQANRGSPDLTVPTASSISLNSGTIVDSLGVAPYLYLQKYLSNTVGSLSYNKNISFNTVKVTNVTSTSANGNYATGETINIQVQLSGSATYTCGGEISLRSQALSAQNATISSGSGTSTLNFSYTVQSADYATDLDYAYTTSLKPAGCHTLKDANGVEVTYTLPSPGAIGSLSYNKNISLNIPATTISVALVAGGTAATYRASTPIAATVSVAGKVLFYVNGKKIAGCSAVSSISLVSTCNWRPSNHGWVLLTARLTPTNGSYTVSNSSPLSVLISSRSSRR